MKDIRPRDPPQCAKRQSLLLLARYGGDEYVVILPGIAAAEAPETAELIRRKLADTVFLAARGEDGCPALNLKGAFFASIGVASYRDCPFAAEPVTDRKVRQRDFIQIADLAIYEAQARGRDRVWAGTSRGGEPVFLPHTQPPNLLSPPT